MEKKLLVGAQRGGRRAEGFSDGDGRVGGGGGPDQQQRSRKKYVCGACVRVIQGTTT